MKMIGRAIDVPLSPRDAVAKAGALIRAANQLAPVAKPRGFVFRAKTHELYEAWKRSQENPRLW